MSSLYSYCAKKGGVLLVKKKDALTHYPLIFREVAKFERGGAPLWEKIFLLGREGGGFKPPLFGGLG